MKQVYTYLSMLYTQKLFIFFHIQILFIRFNEKWIVMACREEQILQICSEQDGTKCYYSTLLYFRKHHRNSFSPPLFR